ncbi:hypothetical protein KFL_003600150 [Klebsormidium nitens]|uniref:GATA-type domain-containing protein n=1 Tax=Klebsormidium nitens TaxID=105231 RepID=A0A1Y1I9B2_KLENI|nr:hypothetical protein KFL_003600150 [Klebsormidium nitens]|eukprot:GAQ87555.1 hypothetical protein KFL_003600150 [Klebsormidium nitens]
MVPALTRECSVCKERKSCRWFIPQEGNGCPPICKTCNAEDAKRKSEPPPPLMCPIVQRGGKTIGRKCSGAYEPGGQQQGSTVLPALPSSVEQGNEQKRGEGAAEVLRRGVLAPTVVQEWDLRGAEDVEGTRRSKRRLAQGGSRDALMTSVGEPSSAKHAKRKAAVEAEMEEEPPEKKRSLREIDKRSAKQGSDPTPDSALAAGYSVEECGGDIEEAGEAGGQQCVGCGVTESRRWYGGGNTCSKCYNREYERNRRARSGGNSAEGSVPHNGGPKVAALEPSPNQGLQKETKSSEPTGELKRNRGRPPLGAPKSSGKKTVAAEVCEAGRCADCGTRKTPQWHAGAGEPETQCQKCHDQGLGGVCHRCGAKSSCNWCKGPEEPKPTCSSCYVKLSEAKTDGGPAGAARGESPLSETKAAPEAVSGEGIPLTGALVSRRVEFWCPVDNRFNAGRIVRFTNYNKWHQIQT